MEKVVVKRFSKDLKTEWDDFVKKSKNGTFMHLRSYMDYHSRKFTDYSLLFYKKKNSLLFYRPI